MDEIKKTVLYDEHLKNDGKIVEFAGYLLPIEYSGITNEHLATRNDVGLFDVSHMGEIEVTGKDTLSFLNYLLICDVYNQKPKRMAYTMMLYQDGGVVDDLMAYKYDDYHYLLVVNASNTDKDFEWIKENSSDFEVQIKNISKDVGQLALQGPNAYKVLAKHTSYNLSKMILFDFDEFLVDGKKMLVSRSGYTGEDGFEIYGTNADIVSLFKAFVEDKVTLCGLGCRDTLRFEAAMPLYGHELSDKINPIMASFGFFVAFQKEFIGKKALLDYKENPTYKLVGIELIDKGIARSGYEIYVLNTDYTYVGYISTGYMIPGTTKAYAMGFIETKYANLGMGIYVKIRKNYVKAIVRDKKFITKKYIK